MMFRRHKNLRVHSLKYHKVKLKAEDDPNNSRFPCKLCYIRYTRMDNLESHIRKIHTSPEEMAALKEDHIEKASLQHACDLCDKKFFLEKLLKYHKEKMHIYTATSYCKLCQMQFESVKRCRDHIHNIHRPNPQEMLALKSPVIEGPWEVACGHCELKFMNKHVRNYHILKTHKEKEEEDSIESNVCTLCKTEFKSNKKRREHVKSFHQNYPEEMEALKTERTTMFKETCKFCKGKFLNLHILNYHVQSNHKEEKRNQPWSCLYCSHKIQPDKNLTIRMKNHMRNAHQLEDIDTLRNQIADIEPDQNVKNFMAMMQAMSEEKL